MTCRLQRANAADFYTTKSRREPAYEQTNKKRNVRNLHESRGRDENTNEGNRKKHKLFLHAVNGGGDELVIPTESASKQ